MIPIPDADFHHEPGNIGKLMSNLMVDVLPGNAKLRDRATRIVCDLTGDSYAEAKATVETDAWVIRKAVARRGRK